MIAELEMLELEEQRLLRRKQRVSGDVDMEQYAETCRQLGDVYSKRGEYGKALDEFKLLLKVNQELRKPLEAACASRSIAEMYMLLEDFEKALEYATGYRDVARKEGNSVELQRAYASIGRIHVVKAESCEEPEQAVESLQEAVKSFQMGLKLSRDLKEVSQKERLDMEARSLLNLGVAIELQGDVKRAIENMESAIKIAQDHDLAELLHQCYTSLALLISTKQKDDVKALKVLNQALEVASGLRNRATKSCETLLVKADILIQNGDFQGARHNLKQAYKLKTPVVSDAANIEYQLKVLVTLCHTEDELVASKAEEHAKRKGLYERMGDGSCKLENYKQAIVYYLKMLQCAVANGDSERDLIPIYVSLYETYRDDQQHEKALEYLWKEYRLIKGNPKEAFNTLLSIAEMSEATKMTMDRIEEIYQKARNQAQKAHSISLERVAINQLVWVLQRHGEDKRADYIEQAAKDRGIDLTVEDACEVDESNDTLDDAVNLAELSNSDDEEESQLHLACSSGNQPLVKKLLKQDHPVNIRNHAGWTPLHRACNNGHHDIVRMLLDRGANINDKRGNSCDGVTPLYEACANGNLGVVELLLARGATNSGNTALHALDKWFRKVQQVLPEARVAFYRRIRECLDPAPVPLPAWRHLIDSDSDSNDEIPAPTSSPRSKQKPRSSSNTATGDSFRTPLKDSSTDTKKKTGSSSHLKEYLNAIQAVHRGSSYRTPLKDSNPEPAGRATCDCKLDLNKQPKRSLTASKAAVETTHNRSRSLSKRRTENRPCLKRPSESYRTPRKDPNSEPAQRATFGYKLDLNRGPNKQPASKTAGSNKTTHARSRSSSESKTENRPCLKRPSDSYRTPLKASNSEPKRAAFDHKLVLDSGPKKQQSRTVGRIPLKTLPNGNAPPGCDGSSRRSLPSARQLQAEQEAVIAATGGNLIQTNRIPEAARRVVRVQVNGKSIEVRFDEARARKLDVGWLKNEVIVRYGLSFGKRPSLLLYREDGDFYENTDLLVTLPRDAKAFIPALVTECQELRADQFYRDYCKQHNIEMIDDLLNELSVMENIDCFTLQRDALADKPCQFKILCKAMGCRGRVQTLKLASNQLTNGDFQKLAEQLPRLSDLQRLDVSINRISSKGINAFSIALMQLSATVKDSQSVLTELTKLNLSSNPLRDNSVLMLCTICRLLQNLKELRLACTAITSLVTSSSPMDISRLEILDLSSNDLCQTSIEFMFQAMSSEIVTEINLKKLGTLPGCKSSLASKLETNDFSMLRVLDISYCGLKDQEFHPLLLSLKKSTPQLELLDASFNPRLTQQSLTNLLATFTHHSLERVRFLRNELMLRNFNASDLLAAIQYDKNKCYPREIQLMFPMRLMELRQDLEGKLKRFWQRIWANRASVKVEDMKVTLSSV